MSEIRDYCQCCNLNHEPCDEYKASFIIHQEDYPKRPHTLKEWADSQRIAGLRLQVKQLERSEFLGELAQGTLKAKI